MQLANKAWANVRLPGAPPLPNVGSDRAGPVSGGQWGRDGRGPNEAADRAAAGVDPIHAARHCAPAHTSNQCHGNRDYPTGTLLGGGAHVKVSTSPNSFSETRWKHNCQ